jgi:hypothetical protein
MRKTPTSPATKTPLRTKPRTPAAIVHGTKEASGRAKWQLAFGFRDAVDLLYEAHPPPPKPRLPMDSDRTQPWCEFEPLILSVEAGP